MDEDWVERLLAPVGAPKKGDRAFRGAEDGWYNACVNWSPGNWDLYATGYKKGADHLVAHILATHSSLDTLVYPIVFLYRQYLELRLKQLWEEGSRLLNRSSGPLLSHRLDEIWKNVRPIIEEVFEGDESSPLDALTELFEEFREIDPKSDGFRYPFDRQGNTTLPGIKHVNLRHLSEVIDRMANVLDGASMGISTYLDQKAEMERGLYR